MKLPHAFTLIETLIVLSIMVMVITVSLPAWKFFLDRHWDESVQYQIMNAIQFARLESQAKHSPIAICCSQDLITCSGSWSDGLLIFRDENETGTVVDKRQILAVIKLKKNNRSN